MSLLSGCRVLPSRPLHVVRGAGCLRWTERTWGHNIFSYNFRLSLTLRESSGISQIPILLHWLRTLLLFLIFALLFSLSRKVRESPIFPAKVCWGRKKPELFPLSQVVAFSSHERRFDRHSLLVHDKKGRGILSLWRMLCLLLQEHRPI